MCSVCSRGAGGVCPVGSRGAGGVCPVCSRGASDVCPVGSRGAGGVCPVGSRGAGGVCSVASLVRVGLGRTAAPPARKRSVNICRPAAVSGRRRMRHVAARARAVLLRFAAHSDECRNARPPPGSHTERLTDGERPSPDTGRLPIPDSAIEELRQRSILFVTSILVYRFRISVRFSSSW